jgi:hypothetical protein
MRAKELQTNSSEGVLQVAWAEPSSKTKSHIGEQLNWLLGTQASNLNKG